MAQIKELKVFYPGNLVLERSDLELAEAIELLEPGLPVEVRHGLFSLASGVRIELGEKLSDIRFVYPNDQSKEIPSETIWRIGQVVSV